MSSISTRQDVQYHIPVIGDIHAKSPLAYRATRGVVEVANVVQMVFAEAYINGVEVPDPVLRLFFDTCMPIVFKHFPSTPDSLRMGIKRNGPIGSRLKGFDEDPV